MLPYYQNLSFNNSQCNFTKMADIPIELYKSLQGVYFVGYADELTFGKGTSAWGWLFNPLDSGVNLHVNVWTVTDIAESTFRVQVWFNSIPPGEPIDSTNVTPSNTALFPLPKPKIKLQAASNVAGNPNGGMKAFVRRGQPETTLVSEEKGKFIFPPGGSFLVFLSNPESPDVTTQGRIAFGWWEEPMNGKCIN